VRHESAGVTACCADDSEGRATRPAKFLLERIERVTQPAIMFYDQLPSASSRGALVSVALV
jgi:hypothetical protein